MLAKKLFTFLSIVLFLGGITMAQDFKYIGAAKCKMCHNKPEKGEQYNKWSGLLHAQAMKSLGNDLSLEYAAKNGIADPTKEASCLKCHSTAHAIDAKLNLGVKPAEGVSCESCHGPGSAYKSPSIMKKQELAIGKGLIVPTEETCKTCHNKDNPFYVEFNYAEALKKIAHPNPLAK